MQNKLLRDQNDIFYTQSQLYPFITLQTNKIMNFVLIERIAFFE